MNTSTKKTLDIQSIVVVLAVVSGLLFLSSLVSETEDGELAWQSGYIVSGSEGDYFWNCNGFIGVNVEVIENQDLRVLFRENGINHDEPAYVELLGEVVVRNTGIYRFSPEYQIRVSDIRNMARHEVLDCGSQVDGQNLNEFSLR